MALNLLLVNMAIRLDLNYGRKTNRIKYVFRWDLNVDRDSIILFVEDLEVIYSRTMEQTPEMLWESPKTPIQIKVIN